jgi:hypothetical protein
MAQIRRRSNRIGYPIQPVAHRKTVTVAGNAELAQPADPARDLLALGIAFVEVVICGAENDAGDARQPRELAFHRDLGAGKSRRTQRRVHRLEFGGGTEHEVELGQ